MRVPGLGPDDLLAQLGRWAAAARVGEAAASRSRARSLADQAAAEATWTGVLVDLAEAGTAVVLAVSGGRRYQGRLAGTGRDFAVLERDGAGPVLVPYRAMTSVAPLGPVGGAGGGAGAGRLVGRPAGRRAPGVDISLAAVLDELAAERSPVGLCLPQEEVVAGDLVAAGDGVLTVMGASRRPLYVAGAAVVAVEIR